MLRCAAAGARSRGRCEEAGRGPRSDFGKVMPRASAEEHEQKSFSSIELCMSKMSVARERTPGMKGCKMSGFARQARTASLILFVLPVVFVPLGEVTPYEGQYDRVFTVTETYDYWDTNTLDGVPDGNPNLPGVQCTLRAALMEAQAQGGTTLINLPLGVLENTISQQFINANVIIEGKGPDSSIIEGNHIAAVIWVGDYEDKTNYTVTIIGVTLRNGTVSDDRLWGGGGVQNLYSTVTLRNVVVTGNAAGGLVQCIFGGGIRNTANMTLENCTVSNNQAAGAGGGIYNDGTLTILNSTLAENITDSYEGVIGPVSGAGLYNYRGSVTVTNSTFSGNRGTGAGGAMFNSGGDDIITATNTTISGNRAGTYGGGIFNWYGGVTLTNVTLAYNIASINGGGIYQYSGSPYRGTTLKNTIIAHNSGGNCAGSLSNVKRAGSNLCSDATCGGGFIVGDPLLGPLQNNGGATFTHALLEGSPAIDAGDDSISPATDQRGVARPQDGNADGTAVSDIGAYEREGAVVPKPDISVSPTSLDFGDVLIGQSSEQTVTVANNGTGELTLGTIASADPLAQPFAIVSDGCSGGTIPLGGSCTFTVRFAPTSAGDFSDTFDIPSNDPDENPVTVYVAGAGAAPGGPQLVSETWSTMHNGGNGHDYIYAVGIDSQGNVIAAGTLKGINSPEHDTSAYLVKYNPAAGASPARALQIPLNDAVVWSDTLEMGPRGGGKDDSYDAFFGLAVDSQDNVIVVGRKSGTYIFDSYHQAMLIRKYAPGGDLLWERTYRDGAESAWQTAWGVALDANDNIYVAGNVFTSWSVGHQWALLKYDKDGTLQPGFPLYYNFSPSYEYADVAYDVAVDKDGDFVAAGYRGVSKTDFDWHVRRYNSSRNLVWQDTYNGTPSLIDYARGVAIDSKGDALVVGYTNKGTDNSAGANYDWLIIKYRAADGYRLWTRTFESATGKSEACYDVLVDALDNVFVAGFQWGSDGIAHWRLERLNGQDGSLLSEQVWESSTNQAIYSLALRNRQIALGGYENNGTNNDMRTAFALPSPPMITSFRRTAENEVSIEWSGAMGKVTILHSPMLIPADWQPIAGPTSAASWSVNLPPGAAAGFYRLQEE